MTYYVIRSKSDDGTYFLVNGWNKLKRIWAKRYLPDTYFHTKGAAKSSLTRLLKVMPEYRFEIFDILHIDVLGNILEREDMR